MWIVPRVEIDIITFETDLLAYSPAAVRYSGSVRRAIFDEDRPTFQLTNKGLHIDLVLYLPGDLCPPGDYTDPHEDLENMHVLVLNCSWDYSS